jgi:hypothetical protein
MIRAALILALVLINFLFCFVEEIYLTVRPLQPGQTAPFALRADRRLTLPAPKTDGASAASGAVSRDTDFHPHLRGTALGGDLP